MSTLDIILTILKLYHARTIRSAPDTRESVEKPAKGKNGAIIF